MTTGKPSILSLALTPGKKIFFLSDFHLGAPNYEESRERERKVIAWMDAHRHEMEALFLLGDIFDYWFEYRHVVQKGFVRLLAKIAELTDAGIPVHFFGGNHDTWNNTYFQQELGMQVYRGTMELHVGDARFLIGHGDGLGANERSYKLMKAIFEAKTSRVLYAALHPYWGSLMAKSMSRHSRKTGVAAEAEQHRRREQWKNRNLLAFMQEALEQKHIDFFIFAHRHWPVLAEIDRQKPEVRVLPENQTALEHGKREQERKSFYLNTGDWIRYCTFASYDGNILKLEGEATQNSF
ncbi:MAG: UDP-2,3-diacylglucosamine diphosphatase [Bacteroides sp.]|nr:UDP-2,3-diacylglucosamine diphosphatase [Ruminococcus flavefaciens]MCM1554333.1 UDP-2,3-diacylglucosamine diphosphatase [Bacteroides sp.]